MQELGIGKNAVVDIIQRLADEGKITSTRLIKKPEKIIRKNQNIICPNKKKFILKCLSIWKVINTEGPKKCMHDCTNCPHKQECSPKVKNNRTIRLNKELTSIHKEVLENLNSIHGALL